MPMMNFFAVSTRTSDPSGGTRSPYFSLRFRLSVSSPVFSLAFSTQTLLGIRKPSGSSVIHPSLVCAVSAARPSRWFASTRAGSTEKIQNAITLHPPTTEQTIAMISIVLAFPVRVSRHKAINRINIAAAATFRIRVIKLALFLLS